MKQLLISLVALSILDIPGQLDKVLIEAGCSDGRTVRVIVKRDDLEKPQTIDNLESILKVEQCK